MRFRRWSSSWALAGASACLVVIGGSGLIVIEAVSRTTQDVDVDVVALEEAGVVVSAGPLPAPVLKAAATVARDLGLEPGAGPVRRRTRTGTARSRG